MGKNRNARKDETHTDTRILHKSTTIKMTHKLHSGFGMTKIENETKNR